MPIRQHLVFDESLFREPPVFRDGIVGHEAGHVIFQNSMRALIKERFPAPEQWKKMAKEFTDENYLHQHIKSYEQKFPSLRNLKETDISAFGVSHSQLAFYRTLKMILEKIVHLQEQSNAQESLDLFILNQMTGFHEVFGDFVGAFFSRDPSWSRWAFADPASRLLRDFRFDPEKGYGPEVANELSDSIKDGAPHLMLLKMRHAIYKHFYLLENETLGKNWDYDIEVAKMVLESFGETYEQVIVEIHNNPNPNDPGGATSAAFLTLASKVFERAIQKVKDKNIEYYLSRKRERDFFEYLRRRPKHTDERSSNVGSDTKEKVIIREFIQHDASRESRR